MEKKKNQQKRYGKSQKHEAERGEGEEPILFSLTVNTDIKMLTK